MSNPLVDPQQPSLKKILGYSSLFAATIGGVASQSSFVSLLNGAGTGGAPFFAAILLAFILTLSYVFSYLELSLMMPKAGGPGTYATVALGHFPSIIIVLAAYVFASPFGVVAELNLLEQIVHTVFPSAFSHIGLIVLTLLTIFNFMGINIFASVQTTIVYVLIVVTLLVGFSGLNGTGAKGASPAELSYEFGKLDVSVFNLMVLVLWSFAGLEYVCPLLEESKRPEKNLPKAMISAAFLLLVIYSLIAYAGMRQLTSSQLSDSEIPHALLVNTMFGNTGKWLIMVFAFTSTSCVVNAVIAGIARMMYGMAHHKELPSIFKKLHPRWDTPWVGILFVFLSIAIPMLLLGNSKDLVLISLISAASLWLVGYIMAHVDVMVLRKKYRKTRRPFKTPLYPLPQIIGILGMGYAIFKNSPSPDMSIKVYFNTGLMVGIAALYAFFWVRFKMECKLFETEPMDEAIAD
jgi:amino acid transporter